MTANRINTLYRFDLTPRFWPLLPGPGFSAHPIGAERFFYGAPVFRTMTATDKTSRNRYASGFTTNQSAQARIGKAFPSANHGGASWVNTASYGGA